MKNITYNEAMARVEDANERADRARHENRLIDAAAAEAAAAEALHLAQMVMGANGGNAVSIEMLARAGYVAQPDMTWDDVLDELKAGGF